MKGKMETGRYSELITFFYTVLKKTSRKQMLLFKDFLKELNIAEDVFLRGKVKDKVFLDILKDIYYSKKLKRSLKEYEPPACGRKYINNLLRDAQEKSRGFFAGRHAGPEEAVIVRESKKLTITASRRFFLRDERILPNEKDVFIFELTCSYHKSSTWITVDFSTRFGVQEGETPGMDTDSITLFDEFIQAIGFADVRKNAQFNAVYTDGQTIYDNECGVSWFWKYNLKSNRGAAGK